MRFLKNAGGNSVISELFSYTYLEKQFGVKLVNTEMEICYSTKDTGIVDYSVELDGKVYGCSVTRCFNYLDLRSKVDEVKLYRLLYKKINGLYSARENMVGSKWDGLILHILVPNSKISKQLYNALRQYATEILYVVTVVKYPVVYFEKPSHIQYIRKDGLNNIGTMECMLPKHYVM